MAYAPSVRRLVEAALAFAATAALFYFGNGIQPLWPLAWIAPLPVLLLALRADWWTVTLVAIAATLVSNLDLWSYLTRTLGAPGYVWWIISLSAAIVFALGVLLFRALVLRGAIWCGLVALPSVWVTGEYLRNVTSPHGTAGSLAYSQLNFLPFLQLASITGPWGMTFVLLLFPSVLAIGLYLWRTSPKRAARVGGVGFAIVAAVLVFGAVRMALPQGDMVRVGLIASDVNGNARTKNPGADTERLLRAYADTARSLTAQGAQAIVIPEKLGQVVQADAAATEAALQKLATDTGATVVAGVVRIDGPTQYNEARIFTPGAPVQSYDKEHMLPPFESNLKPGTTLTLLPHPHAPWGVAICKDMDFASPARRYGKAGAGLLLVPAWDFVVDASWHGHIAIMRGVEDGFSMARAAKNGFLTVSDNRGRIVGEVRSNSASFATLLADVPTEHAWTVYQLLGNWFAWLAMAIAVLDLAQLIRVMRARRIG